MRLFGLIGDPIENSPSPRLYNTAFKRLGLPHRYLPFCVEARYLKNLVACMKLCDVAGLNVTIPYKEKVIPFLDGLDPSARLCGAVNTVVRRGNRFIGTNTDGAGFLRALRRLKRIHPKNKAVLIAGAGGTARAIAAALAAAGARAVWIWNRHPGRARRLAAFFRKKFPGMEWQVAASRRRKGADLYVQTTPRPLKLPSPSFDIRIGTRTGRALLAEQARLNLKLWLSSG